METVKAFQIEVESKGGIRADKAIIQEMFRPTVKEIKMTSFVLLTSGFIDEALKMNTLSDALLKKSGMSGEELKKSDLEDIKLKISKLTDKDLKN